MPKKIIDSWKIAQEWAPGILRRLHDEPPLLLAALSNPILALEELGYELAPSFREEFTARARFSKRDAARVRTLREEIFRHSGGPFDLGSPSEVERLLFERLRLARPQAKATVSALPARARTDAPDPFEELRGRHPIVGPLLEYRRLDARAPGLAPRELFDAIRAGERRLPITRVRVRFEPQNVTEG